MGHKVRYVAVKEIKRQRLGLSHGNRNLRPEELSQLVGSPVLKVEARGILGIKKSKKEKRKKQDSRWGGWDGEDLLGFSLSACFPLW